MSKPRQIVLIAHNLRSAHNVGSLLRTADGFGVSKVILSGYTPYPSRKNDERLPHISEKLTKQIHKTALGAESSVDWHHESDINKSLTRLSHEGFAIVGLEQATNSIPLPSYKAPQKVALVVGREVEGLEPEVLALCSPIVEIPMAGQKESFNVVQAAAVALYQLAL